MDPCIIVYSGNRSFGRTTFVVETLPALVLLLRLLIVEIKIWSIGRRLGERKMAGTYILYDLVAPLSELCLALSRRLRPQ